jgi:uroporphyrinogen III methyltransferase/synthase
LAQKRLKHLSLKGKVIAITRPKKQARELAELVSKLGGKPYVVPTVEIKPLLDRQPITEFVNNVLNKRVDHVIFMSVNGVTSLIDSLEKMEQKDSFLKELNGAMIVAIGPKTERKLEEHGIEANLVSPKHSSEGIVESLKKMDMEGKTVAVLRSSIANNYLRRELEKMGANVLEFPAYESAPPSDDSKVLVFLNDLFKGKIDAITFTSSSTAQNLFKIAGEHVLAEKFKNSLQKTIVTAIGSTTQGSLEELGIKVDVVPKEYTIEAMMEALVRYMQKNNARWAK